MNTRQILELSIKKLANTGEGLGYADGRTILVRGAFPGEEVGVKLREPSQTTKEVVFADLVTIKQAHPKRIDSGPFSAGTPWQNLTYDQQLSFKQDMLRDVLAYYGKFKVEELPLQSIIPSAEQKHYRNKITLNFFAGGLGTYEAESHVIGPDHQQLLVPAFISELIDRLEKYFLDKGLVPYDRKADSGDFRQLVLKWNKRSEVLLGLVTRHKTMPLREKLAKELPRFSTEHCKIIGVVQNINKLADDNILGPKSRAIWGNEYLAEEIGATNFQHTLASFFQVNSAVAENIIALIEAALPVNPSGLLYDLYGGIGFLSIPLAKRFAQIVIVENNQEAIEMAAANCRRNKVANAVCIQEDAEEFLQKRSLFPTTIFLDPPRSGCPKSMVERLLILSPQTIVYTSCFPVTLARDLAILTQNGQYQIKKIQPLDMFPQTPHLETVVFLEGKQKFL